MRRLLVGGLLGPLFLTAFAHAQDARPFPLDVTAVDTAREEVTARARLDAVQDLLGLDQVRMTDVQLPFGPSVDLDLTRIDLERMRFGFLVDGERRPDLLPNLDLTLWKGTVVGDPDSTVRLSFSNTATNGWIHYGGRLVHFVPRPDGQGSWTNGDVLVVTETSLNQRGMFLDNDCQATPVPGERTLPPGPAKELGNPNSYASCSQRECKIAIESDYQLYQVWNDLGAMTTYITTLLGFVSDRYETQVDTILTFPYMQFYTNSNDPWTSQDSGGGCVDVLYEFQAAWAGNVPGGANLGHFLSGANLGCGVAWVDVLCDDTYNFSVSGNINGNVQFPVVQQPNNWDFMVIAHELGHNFGSYHTHDYCPPLDECYDNCNGVINCTNQGTIMSYCHLCPGGTANITTYFHTTIAGIITAEAAACLPGYVSITADFPELLAPGVPTPVSATVMGTVVGNVELYYRYDGGSYNSVVMTDQGGGLYAADLPAPDCDDLPEFYFAFTDATCGLVTSPDGAPGTVHTAEVGTLTAVFVDDFESDTGWTPENLGATTGDWQRGVPVDDPGWDYDPSSDYDGSGQCYLTQNQTGNTDVDEGAVRLTSPALDMTGGEPFISYAYYLRLTNDDGTDMLLVEASSNGLAGPWDEIARHDTNGGTSWRTHAISAADLSAAGVTLTADMRLRFTANDGDSQSIVEGGLDAFDLSILGCDDDTQIGSSYCGPAVQNSSGQSAVIAAYGSDFVVDNDVTLEATQLATNEFGYFVNSQTQDFVVGPGGSQGNLCLGGTTGRHISSLGSTGAAGELSTVLDLTQLPTAGGPYAVQPGETWNFQCWFRDHNPGSTSNFTDGVEILFQ